MKETKREYCVFRPYDVNGMEAHLAGMAKAGWMISEFGTRLWKYEKTEPKTLKFYVQYKSEDLSILASYAGDKEKEKMANASAEEKGWKYAGTWNNARIYYAEDLEAAPLEDDKERLSSIRMVSNKALVAQGIVIGLLLGLLGMNISEMVKYPMDFYGDSAGSILLIMGILVILVLGYICIEQILWIHKAERMGTLPPVHTKRNKIMDIVGIIVVILLFIWFAIAELKGSSTEAGIIFIGTFVVIIAFIAVEQKMLSTLKKKKVSRGKQWLAIGGMIAVMMLVLIGGINRFVMSDDFNMADSGPQDVPLTLQDFITYDEKEAFSYDYSHGKSLLLEKISMYQYGDADYMDIYIARVKNEKRYDWFLEKALSEIGYRLGEAVPVPVGFAADDFWEKADDSSWGADQVYRQKSEEGEVDENTTWVLAKKPYIISVDLSFTINEKQKKMIVKKLIEGINE